MSQTNETVWAFVPLTPQNISDSIQPSYGDSASRSSNDLSDCKMSNEKNPGWLFYIRDYTTQLYRDYNKPL